MGNRLKNEFENFHGPRTIIIALAVVAASFAAAALLPASIVGLILVNPADILWNLSGSMTEVMMDEDTGWLIIVCGLMGSIMTLIERAGGASLRSYPYFNMGCICRKNTGIIRLGA